MKKQKKTISVPRFVYDLTPRQYRCWLKQYSGMFVGDGNGKWRPTTNKERIEIYERHVLNAHSAN